MHRIFISISLPSGPGRKNVVVRESFPGGRDEDFFDRSAFQLLEGLIPRNAGETLDQALAKLPAELREPLVTMRAKAAVEVPPEPEQEGELANDLQGNVLTEYDGMTHGCLALVRFDNGAKGAFSVGQVCAGHKNDVVLEVCGGKSSLKWRQEHQNELWFGHRDQPNQILQKDPGLMDEEVRGYAHLPGGHQEAWADAFCNLMRDIYGFIAAGKKPGDAHPPAFATFEDGYRANVIVETILASARNGSVWTKVQY